MRLTDFSQNGYFHLYNRGTDKRDIFLEDRDFQRFYESLYLFNDKNYNRKGGQIFERVVQLSGAEVFAMDRDCLVSILSYKLMTNHYHLLLREEQEGGVSAFMHRLGTGYTNYFNVQMNRSGSLFQGPFQAVHVASDSQLEHLVRYIHLNELDRYGIPWREGEVVDWEQCFQLLHKDPYSSHGLYCGREQKLPVIDAELAKNLFPDSEEYLDFLKGWTQRSLLELPDDSLHLE